MADKRKKTKVPQKLGRRVGAWIEKRFAPRESDMLVAESTTDVGAAILACLVATCAVIVWLAELGGNLLFDDGSTGALVAGLIRALFAGGLMPLALMLCGAMLRRAAVARRRSAAADFANTLLVAKGVDRQEIDRQCRELASRHLRGIKTRNIVAAHLYVADALMIQHFADGLAPEGVSPQVWSAEVVRQAGNVMALRGYYTEKQARGSAEEMLAETLARKGEGEEK